MHTETTTRHHHRRFAVRLSAAEHAHWLRVRAALMTAYPSCRTDSALFRALIHRAAPAPLPHGPAAVKPPPRPGNGTAIRPRVVLGVFMSTDERRALLAISKHRADSSLTATMRALIKLYPAVPSWRYPSAGPKP